MRIKHYLFKSLHDAEKFFSHNKPLVISANKDGEFYRIVLAY